MCLATVYVDDDGQMEEVMRDVAWIEPESQGVLLISFLGERQLFHTRIKSIDLMHSSIVLEKGEGHKGSLQGGVDPGGPAR